MHINIQRAPAFLTSTPVDETAFPLRPLGRPEKRIIQISFRIFTYSYSPRRRFEPTHKEPLPAGEAMQIRGITYGHTYHATTRPRRPLHTPFRRGIGHRDRCALSPPLHPWLCRATNAAASSSQLQRRGERLVYPESKRAAGWVENRAEVISMRVRMKGVIGAGVSGSKGERPGTMNVQRVASAVAVK